MSAIDTSTLKVSSIAVLKYQEACWNEIRIGTELRAFEYVLTQAQVDNYRVDKLLTHRYSLDQAVEAFCTFDGATTGKCVFEID